MSGIRLVSVYSGYVPGVSPSEDRDLAPVIAVRSSTESWDTWQDIYEDIAMKTRRKVFAVNVRIPEEDELRAIGFMGYHNDPLNCFMEERNISRAVLIGHSMAAYIMLPLTLQKPEKVEKLIVADIHPWEICQVLNKVICEFVSLMKESLSSIPDAADEVTAKKAIRDYFFSKMPQFKEVLSGVFENLEDMPLICKSGVYKWHEVIDTIQETFTVTDNTKPIVSGLEEQILFLNGEESDIKTNEDKDIILKFFPSARFYDIENATRTMPKEDAADQMHHKMHQEFLREVLKFLNE